MIADTLFAPVRSTTAFDETLVRLSVAIQLGLLEPGTRLPSECSRMMSAVQNTS